MDVTFDLIAIGLAVFFAAGFVDSIAGGGGLITLPALLSLRPSAAYDPRNQ